MRRALRRISAPCESRPSAINQDWNAIAGVIDKQSFARRMRLAHRRRQFCLEGSIKFAEPRIAVAAWVLRNILVPNDQQGDVLAFHLPMNRRPVRFGMAPMTPFAASVGVKRRFQLFVAQALG